MDVAEFEGFLFTNLSGKTLKNEQNNIKTVIHNYYPLVVICKVFVVSIKTIYHNMLINPHYQIPQKNISA